MTEFMYQAKQAIKRGVHRLRMAEDEDSFLLWEWSNDPLARENSFNSNAITWEQHKSWFEAKLASPDCRIWILEFNNLPVGQIRYERMEVDKAQISLCVAPHFRGMQLGTYLLRATPTMASRELGVKVVEGITFVENEASQRAFAKAGFTLASRHRIGGRDCLIFTLCCNQSSKTCGD